MIKIFFIFAFFLGANAADLLVPRLRTDQYYQYYCNEKSITPFWSENSNAFPIDTTVRRLVRYNQNNFGTVRITARVGASLESVYLYIHFAYSQKAPSLATPTVPLDGVIISWSGDSLGAALSGTMNQYVGAFPWLFPLISSENCLLRILQEPSDTPIDTTEIFSVKYQTPVLFHLPTPLATAKPPFQWRVEKRTMAAAAGNAITFRVRKAGFVTIDAIDLSGRIRGELKRGYLQPGVCTIGNRPLSAFPGEGVYMVRLRADGYTETSRCSFVD